MATLLIDTQRSGHVVVIRVFINAHNSKLRLYSHYGKTCAEDGFVVSASMLKKWPKTATQNNKYYDFLVFVKKSNRHCGIKKEYRAVNVAKINLRFLARDVQFEFRR
jgi:uncharacterized protein YneR